MEDSKTILEGALCLRVSRSRCVKYKGPKKLEANVTCNVMPYCMVVIETLSPTYAHVKTALLVSCGSVNCCTDKEGNAYVEA